MISWVFLLCFIEQDSKLQCMSSIPLGIFLIKFFNSVHLSWLGICKPTFIFPQHPYIISHQNYSILCHSISTLSEFPSLGKPIMSTDYMCVCIHISICLSIHPSTAIYIHIFICSLYTYACICIFFCCWKSGNGQEKEKVVHAKDLKENVIFFKLFL